MVKALKWDIVNQGLKNKGFKRRKGNHPHPIYDLMNLEGEAVGVIVKITNPHGKKKVGGWLIKQISARLNINDPEFVTGVIECTISRERLLQRLHEVGRI